MKKQRIQKLCVVFAALLLYGLTWMSQGAVTVAADDSYYASSRGKAGEVVVYGDSSFQSVTQRYQEGWMQVNGETAFCFNCFKTFREGARRRIHGVDFGISQELIDQLAVEYYYIFNETTLTDTQKYLIYQCLLWEHVCQVVDRPGELSLETSNTIINQAKAYYAEHGASFHCIMWVYTDGVNQDVVQFEVEYQPKGRLQINKSSANPEVTREHPLYSLAGARYGVYGDEACTDEKGILTTDSLGNSQVMELEQGNYWIKELAAPEGYLTDPAAYRVEVDSAALHTVTLSDMPASDHGNLILKKINEYGEDYVEASNSMAGATFTVEYYDGYYSQENLPSKPTRTWTLSTKKEQEDGKICCLARLSQDYLVSGDPLYLSDGETILPLGTIRIYETAAPEGYLLEGNVLYVDGQEVVEAEKGGVYLAHIQKSGDQVSLDAARWMTWMDQNIRGGLYVEKWDQELKEPKAQGAATLEGAVLEIISESDYLVQVDGKFYQKGETVKTLTIEKGRASTEADTLPYGTYRVREAAAPEGYLLAGEHLDQMVTIEKQGEIVRLDQKETAVCDTVKRGDLKLVKVEDGTLARMAHVRFTLTSKTTGESHSFITDENGCYDTSASWNPHSRDTNRGKTREDGIWFGAAEPDDTRGALLYDTYLLEEQPCEANAGHTLASIELTIRKDQVTVDLGTITDDLLEEPKEEPKEEPTPEPKEEPTPKPTEEPLLITPQPVRTATAGPKTGDETPVAKLMIGMILSLLVLGSIVTVRSKKYPRG